MPERQQLRPHLQGNQCNMTDILQRISLSKPHVDQGMYRTLYMIDYQHYAEHHQWRPMTEPSQRLKLEAQLKEKELAKPAQKKEVKYVEEAGCQEVQPPYPVGMVGRASKGKEAPPRNQEHQEHWSYYPPLEDPTAVQEKEAEILAQPEDAVAVTGTPEAPCLKQEQGQNWNSYQQFLLENRRANQVQVQEIKRLNLETSVFPRDFIRSTEASTYQKDYKSWPRVQGGYCRPNRNFSSLFLEDGYYKDNPWTSEYMDNYSIFLRKLQWNARNPVSSFCSAVKPIPHISHGMPSQTPIAVNTAL
ncbi:hypothetical protein JRQ81_004669 [Phrynocephalus forsythii]|uniref:Uncharacterized protein n=1 Tax=Phrynocephalus forsythii TaxID=171643 RepID=A0A9Q0XGJ1_9SAUR|nr:hypothetical protein JRQ81_004669 [Phrynocephalus forsythii]